MSKLKLTSEDLQIMYGRSAKATFTAAVAQCFLKSGEGPGGEGMKRWLLKALQENLKRASSPAARYPMPDAEQEELRQYYRIFLGFYHDPNLPENLPSDSMKQ